MKIERADIAQLDAVLALLEQQFNEHDIAWQPAQLRQAASGIVEDESRGLFLLAWKGDEAIGLAAIAYAWTLEHGGKSAWLDELYVLPERRGQGVGGALVQKAMEIARQEGCLALDLEVEEGHRRAEHLYRRWGFEKLHRRRWVVVL